METCDYCKKKYKDVYWKLICDVNGNETELWLCAGCWYLQSQKEKESKPAE